MVTALTTRVESSERPSEAMYKTPHRRIGCSEAYMARELRASFKRFASRAAKARTWFETAGRPEIRVTGALRMSRELSRDSLRLASTGAGCLLAPLLVALRAAGAPRKVLCRLMTSQVGDTDHHVNLAFGGALATRLYYKGCFRSPFQAHLGSQVVPG